MCNSFATSNVKNLKVVHSMQNSLFSLSFVKSDDLSYIGQFSRDRGNAAEFEKSKIPPVNTTDL